MKTYMGLPGEEPVISVTDNATGETATLPGTFSWGKGANALHARDTAKAILTDHLGDEAQATRLCSRFQWRKIAELAPDKPWTITSTEIATILADITAGEKELAQTRAAVDREQAPIANEGGMGVAGGQLSPVENKG